MQRLSPSFVHQILCIYHTSIQILPNLQKSLVGATLCDLLLSEALSLSLSSALNPLVKLPALIWPAFHSDVNGCEQWWSQHPCINPTTSHSHPCQNEPGRSIGVESSEATQIYTAIPEWGKTMLLFAGLCMVVPCILARKTCAPNNWFFTNVSAMRLMWDLDNADPHDQLAPGNQTAYQSGPRIKF